MGGLRGKGTDIPPMLQDSVRNGRIKIIKFDRLEDCVAHIKCINNEGNEGGETDADPVKILGVEIDKLSSNLEIEPFSESGVAFMMGNEGAGMTTKKISVFDGFVQISQHGGGTASLNVSVAAGIILHRLFHWDRGDGVKHVHCNDNSNSGDTT